MELLSPSLVLTSFEAKDKKDVIYKLSSLLLAEERITNLEAFVKNVMARENEFSTGFGEGMAIPHGKCQEVITPTVVVAKLSQGIEWEAMDGKPVQLVFLLAVPQEDAGTTHLRIMAKLAEKLMDDDVVKKLIEIQDNNELYTYIKKLLGGE